MYRRMLRQILLLAALTCMDAAPARAADPAIADEQWRGCCAHDSADIGQMLKNADRFYRQFKPQEAVAELLKILHLDGRNFEALVRLARAYIDIGDAIAEQGTAWKESKRKEYAVAEDYARRAVTVDANSTWSHFWVAASLGSIAVVSPVANQIELSSEIRDAVERSIALDPKNGSAYHIYGVWHRKVAEIGRTRRIFASVFYGRSVPKGSLEKSIEYLKKAVALNPTVIISRLELARTHVDREEWPQARALLKSVAALPIQFSDDAKHKQKAEMLLEEIRDR